jgi:hypothetical protein
LTANSQSEQLDPSSDDLTLPASQTPVLSHGAPVFASPSYAPLDTFETSVSDVPANDMTAGTAAETADTPFGGSDFALSPPPALAPAAGEPPTDLPEPVDLPVLAPDETLSEIEQSVNSPHLGPDEATLAAETVDDARDAVEAALNGAATANPDPIIALNAQPALENINNAFPEQNTGTLAPSGLTMGANPAAGVAPAFTPPNLHMTAAGPSRPSAFPGTVPQAQGDDASGMPPPPPVPPPMVPPIQ